MASGHTGRTHDRTRPMLQQRQKVPARAPSDARVRPNSATSPHADLTNFNKFGKHNFVLQTELPAGRRCAPLKKCHRADGTPGPFLERSISSASGGGRFRVLILSVFDDFGVRLITLRTFECAPVVIGFVWLDATKPHRCATVRALRQVESQSRWIKYTGCGHGWPHTQYRNLTLCRCRV
jgi:hypothetical protein